MALIPTSLAKGLYRPQDFEPEEFGPLIACEEMLSEARAGAYSAPKFSEETARDWMRPGTMNIDRNNDGVADARAEFEYTFSGRPESLSVTNLQTKSKEYTVTFEKDGFGKVKAAQVDLDNDGVIDADFKTYFSFRAAKISGMDIDRDRDGISDARIAFNRSYYAAVNAKSYSYFPDKNSHDSHNYYVARDFWTDRATQIIPYTLPDFGRKS